MLPPQKPSLTLVSFHRDGETLDPTTQQFVKDLTLKISRSGITVLKFTRGLAGISAIFTDAAAPDAIELKIAVLDEQGDHVVTFRIAGLAQETVQLLVYGIRTQTKCANQVEILFTPQIQDADVTLAHWTSNPDDAVALQESNRPGN